MHSIFTSSIIITQGERADAADNNELINPTNWLQKHAFLCDMYCVFSPTLVGLPRRSKWTDMWVCDWTALQSWVRYRWWTAKVLLFSFGMDGSTIRPFKVGY